MTSDHRSGLQLTSGTGEDLLSYRIERVGWACLFLIVLATLLGLFGRGWLSHVRLAAPDGVAVEYERFTRQRSETELRFVLPPTANARHEASVWLDRDFMQQAGDLQITPRPRAEQIAGDRVRYTFDLADASVPAELAFSFQPERPGRHRARVGVVGGPAFDIAQLVYP